ncbi:hypothetical protein E2C01_099370 [Portunus trituberculatus]|uniref:Uncharacterized protein n=1 Tax=Portunus trituberculatus TaxID=210409 RepID=A0A5B7K9F7_PORTR|nr:hypothetical protein [Portunus trituberculatus]
MAVAYEYTSVWRRRASTGGADRLLNPWPGSGGQRTPTEGWDSGSCFPRPRCRCAAAATTTATERDADPACAAAGPASV